MNRRSNKILKDLILGIHADVSGLEEKYNIQERTIRADIKELNKDLEAYELPVIASDLDGKLWMTQIKKWISGPMRNLYRSTTFILITFQKRNVPPFLQ